MKTIAAATQLSWAGASARLRAGLGWFFAGKLER